MNRRKFLTFSVVSTNALLVLPTSIFASHVPISLYTIGTGFDKLSSQIEHISVKYLTEGFINTHNKLMEELKRKSFIYNPTEVVKLSEACFCIPLKKDSMMGFSSKELALIIKNEGVYKHYILDEKIAAEFSSLIENFSAGVESHSLDLNTLEFALPTKVLEQSHGKENVFVYENKMKNKISIKSCAKKSRTLVN